MAIRINRVYTRTGDGGETSLVGGQRVPKVSPRIEAFGCVDELNSFVGLALTEIPAAAGGGLEEIRELLTWIQQKLFDVGACLATPPEHAADVPSAGPGDVERLEAAMDRWERSLPELKSFVLPGGGKLTAQLHVARTVCRRAEIQILKLHQESPVGEAVRAFINRLADFLFVAARRAAELRGEPEVLWSPSAPASQGGGSQADRDR